MRNYRVKELFPTGVSSTAVDSVSRYEMHFFNALYNIRPDKLKKFAAEQVTETGVIPAGLYHNAYVSYSKHIGPDSTKNSRFSTHIDKRWDSIAVMPEMDFDFQQRQMIKIHQAMIYGLLLNAIRSQKVSNQPNAKEVYRYQSSDEHSEELIVSNGSVCDEFYEILDALYINAAMVADVMKVVQKRSNRDVDRHTSFEDSAFAAALREFDMGDGAGAQPF